MLKTWKYEWRKTEKELYLPKESPSLVHIPEAYYITISGEGNPNMDDFSERVSVLYAVAYAIRMMPKNGYIPDNYYEYTVYPLEGTWDIKNDIVDRYKLVKEDFIYTIKIKQPDFVTQEVFEKALMITQKKKPHSFLEQVKITKKDKTVCVQLMHTGSYDSEPISFAKMNQFLDEHSLIRTTKTHQEIYIKPKKGEMTEDELKKLKTVLRYECREA